VQPLESRNEKKKGGSQEMTVMICTYMVKANTDYSDKFGNKSCRKENTNSPELFLLKLSLLTYHHSHFLTTTLDFTSCNISSWLN